VSTYPGVPDVPPAIIFETLIDATFKVFFALIVIIKK
jgi:hypothetical protein